MWRTTLRLTPTFIFPLFRKRNENDFNMLTNTDVVQENSGWERVKQMYTKGEYEDVSVELTNVIQTTLCGTFFGACLGGFVKSRNAYLYFIENNQATIFKTTREAQKKLQDYVTIAFAKGAYNWGWRLGFFTALFSLTATTISVYKGNTSLVEYVTAGALTGALYKANLGAAATFVGALVGATLSTIGGLGILGILKVSGFEMDDIRKSLHKIKEAREDQFNQVLEKAAVIKNDSLTRHHEHLVEEKGVKKLSELETK